MYAVVFMCTCVCACVCVCKITLMLIKTEVVKSVVGEGIIAIIGKYIISKLHCLN